ncbi:MAG: hypothetical protein H5T97_04020 [Firmicutes bacterium]|nr:hypothetical protein [Bacillota bacterium]
MNGAELRGDLRRGRRWRDRLLAALALVLLFALAIAADRAFLLLQARRAAAPGEELLRLPGDLRGPGSWAGGSMGLAVSPEVRPGQAVLIGNPGTQTREVKIVDGQGRELWRGTVPAGFARRVPVALPPGEYFAAAEDGPPAPGGAAAVGLALRVRFSVKEG